MDRRNSQSNFVRTGTQEQLEVASNRDHQASQSYSYVLRNDGGETSGKQALISNQSRFRKISDFSHIKD